MAETAMHLKSDTRCARCLGRMKAGDAFWWDRKGGGYGFKSCGAAPERYRPAHAFNCQEVESLRFQLAKHDEMVAGFVASFPDDVRAATEAVMAQKRAAIVASINSFQAAA